MIDTMFLRIKFTDIDTSGFNPMSTVDEEGVIHKTKFRLRNLSITINKDEEVTYIQGSIKKFHFGEGALDDLSFGDLKEAIASIVEKTGIPSLIFNQAEIIRLDMGMTIEVSKPVKEYIKAIQSKARLEPDKFSDESVQFEGTKKKIIFYDKYKERVSKGKIKPKDLTLRGKKVSHENWLRYEVQWKKASALQDQLFGTRTLLQIFDNYSRLLDRVMTEFKQVHFSTFRPIKVIGEVSNSSDALASALVIAAEGEGAAIALIDRLTKEGLVKKNYAAYCRKKVRESLKNFEVVEYDHQAELMNEVQIGLEKAYEFYKSDVLRFSAGERRKLQIEPTEEMPADLGEVAELDLGNLLLKE